METSLYPSMSESSIGVDEDSGYRTLSVLSIVSVVLGLVSPLCLIAPLLCAIPIAGAVVALFAIRQISISDGGLTGRGAAMVALALCVASISASVARSALMHELLARQARQSAIEWFALLQNGDAENAFDRTVASRQPPPPRDRNEPQDGQESSPTPLATFRAQKVEHFLLEDARNWKVRYQQEVSYDPGVSGQAYIEQQYVVDGLELPDGRTKALVLVTMQRVPSNGSSQWLVANAQSDDLPAVSTGQDDSHSHVH